MLREYVAGVDFKRYQSTFCDLTSNVLTH